MGIEIRDSIRQFVLTHFPTARKRPLDDQDPLLERGIVDSLGILDMIAFLESEFQITVNDDDLIPENFKDIARITHYVEAKKNQCC